MVRLILSFCVAIGLAMSAAAQSDDRSALTLSPTQQAELWTRVVPWLARFARPDTDDAASDLALTLTHMTAHVDGLMSACALARTNRPAPVFDIGGLSINWDTQIRIADGFQAETETGFDSGLQCLGETRFDAAIGFAVSVFEDTLPVDSAFLGGLTEFAFIPMERGATQLPEDLRRFQSFLEDLGQDSAQWIAAIERSTLPRSLARDDREGIIEALEQIAYHRAVQHYVAEMQALIAQNLPPQIVTAEPLETLHLDGCWFGHDGLYEVEDDGGTLFVQDPHGEIWVGEVEGNTALLTLRFFDLSHYRQTALRLAGGLESPELDAITATLHDAGVRHEISLLLPDDLASAQMLEAEFRETLVAEPVVGSASPAYTAVLPSAAVHGTVWQFPAVWARMALCP